jgi:hypothetical protein
MQRSGRVNGRQLKKKAVEKKAVCSPLLPLCCCVCLTLRGRLSRLLSLLLLLLYLRVLVGHFGWRRRKGSGAQTEKQTDEPNRTQPVDSQTGGCAAGCRECTEKKENNEGKQRSGNG